MPKFSIKRAFFGLTSALVLIASLGAFAQTDAPNPRIALVIGNAAYPDQALTTTANDAGLIAQTLQTAGFDVVGARDLDQKSLQSALRDFFDKAAAAGPDMQAFVYLAGRAQQYNGDNYFLPVDAKIARDGDLPLAAIRISDVAHALAATPGRARILVIDGARSNPYVASNPSIAPGLALEPPEAGELIAFDASPGALAGDEQGPYGVYGKTLAGALRQGGVDIAAVFDQTRVLVNQQTQGAVIPWSQSNLGAPYYVFERAADAPPPPVIPAPAIVGGSADEAYYAALQRDTIRGYDEFLRDYPHSDQARRVRAILAARREASFWERTVTTNSARAYWTYLRRYPKGPHVGDARRRIAMLAVAFDPPPDFRPLVYEDLPPPPPAEADYFERSDYAFDDFGPPPPPPPPAYFYGYDDDWRDLPPPPPPRDVGFLPVLAVAIPVIVGAIAYQGRGRDNGVAPAGYAPPPAHPPAPPALPPSVHPVAAAAPTATPIPTAGGAGRPGRPGFSGPRPLPPIALTAKPCRRQACACSSAADAFGDLDASCRQTRALSSAADAFGDLDASCRQTCALSSAADAFGDLDASCRQTRALSSAADAFGDFDASCRQACALSSAADAFGDFDASCRQTRALSSAADAFGDLDASCRQACALSSAADAFGDFDASCRQTRALSSAADTFGDFDASCRQACALSSAADAFGDFDASCRQTRALSSAADTFGTSAHPPPPVVHAAPPPPPPVVHAAPPPPPPVVHAAPPPPPPVVHAAPPPPPPVVHAAPPPPPPVVHAAPPPPPPVVHAAPPPPVVHAAPPPPPPVVHAAPPPPARPLRRRLRLRGRRPKSPDAASPASRPARNKNHRGRSSALSLCFGMSRRRPDMGGRNSGRKREEHGGDTVSGPGPGRGRHGPGTEIEDAGDRGTRLAGGRPRRVSPDRRRRGAAVRPRDRRAGADRRRRTARRQTLRQFLRLDRQRQHPRRVPARLPELLRLVRRRVSTNWPRSSRSMSGPGSSRWRASSKSRPSSSTSQRSACCSIG